MKRWEKRSTTVGVAVVLFGAFASTLLTVHSPSSAKAEDIVRTCAEAEQKAACYESHVPMLYPARSIEDIFKIVRMIRDLDPSYQFCHVLSHKLGERVVADDPEAWIDAIPLNPPDGLCSNGFIHGVIGGRFRAEVLDDETLAALTPDFSRACEPRENWQPSELDQAICYHGLGHLYTFITDAALSKALALCEKTANKNGEDFRKVCIEGVFMQIYQPLEPDDFLMIERMSVKPTKETVRDFCRSFSEPRYVGACVRESWPFFRKEIIEGKGAEVLCSGHPNDTETDNCYLSVSAIVGRLSVEGYARAADACMRFPPDRQEVCFAASAQAVLEEDRNAAEASLALCRLAPGPLAEACVRTLVSHASFIFGADDLRYTQFCTALPLALLQECLNSIHERTGS